MIVTKVKNNPLRSLAGAAIAISVIAIAGQSVLATLNAEVFNSPQSVSAGTLNLSLADASTSAGFSSSVSNLAPGDTVNRYVTLTNTGNLDGKGLRMKITATGAQELVTDGVAPSTTKALRVTVTSCAVAWVSGNCVSPQVEIASTPLSTLATAAAFSTGELSASAAKYLQIKLVLPDQNETTTNGAGPSSSIQGKSASLTYTFDFEQRVASTTNS